MADLVTDIAEKKEIAFTPTALTEIRRLVKANDIGEDKVLRVGVKGGGCAGFTYILDFDTPTANDTIYNIDGVKVAVDLMHELYLKGTVIDFQSGLNNRGFIYNNPNASKTCGCGESFG